MNSAKKRSAFEWFGLTPEERFKTKLSFTKKELAQDLGVSEDTIHKWFRDYQKMLAEPTETKGVAITEDELAQFRRLIFDVANSPKATNKDRELASKVFGILVERQQREVTHKIDGSYFAKELIRARRELEGEGMAQVPDESRILPADLRLPPGQEQNQDS